MKIYNILLTAPEPNTYYIRTNNQFANAFRKFNHKVFILNKSISRKELFDFIQKKHIDTIIQINQPKVYNLPSNVIHITWFQDVFDEQKNIKKYIDKKKSIIYTLGNPLKIGLGFIPPCIFKGFYTGIDKKIIISNYKGLRNIDVNHVGYIPKPFLLESESIILGSILTNLIYLFEFIINNIPMSFINYFKRVLKLLILIPFLRLIASKIIALGMRHEILKIMTIIEQNFKTLGGNLDILKIKKNIRKEMSTNYFQLVWPRYKYIVREYPRYLDRISIADSLLQASKSLNVYIAGYNWNLYRKYKKITHNHIDNYSKLLSIYKNSKITLCNNNHGLGMHSRVLEAMACGSFILMNESPLSNLDGGLGKYFIKGKHYDEYNENNLIEKINYWVKNDEKRLNATKNVLKIIKKKHLWENRVAEIMQDINQL